MRTGRIALLLTAAGLTLTACTSEGSGEAPDTAPETAETAPETLTILSHESFVEGSTEDTFAAFTEDTGIEVELVPAGDAGATVNQAILTKDNPLADVLFGVDDSFLSRALDEEIFVSHESELLDKVDPRLIIDDEHRVTPIDYGDVCLNYDKQWFEDNDVEPPSSLDDLVLPEYHDLLVVEDPASSSPGLAFLHATIDRFGTEWPGYWESLVANDVAIVSDWNTAYYSDFSHHGGEDPIVVSYASSPPAEVMFADPPVDTAPTGVVTDGCYRQIEFAGVLANTEYPEAAGDLIDYMLSEGFQAEIPTTWFVFPANSQVDLPEVFADNTVIPDDPVSLDPAEIADNRDTWIDQWRQIAMP